MENASVLQHKTPHQSLRISSNKIFVSQTPGAFHYRRLISRSTAICINIVSKEVLKTIENYFETYLVVETVSFKLQLFRFIYVSIMDWTELMEPNSIYRILHKMFIVSKLRFSPKILGTHN